MRPAMCLEAGKLVGPECVALFGPWDSARGLRPGTPASVNLKVQCETGLGLDLLGLDFI